MEYTFNCERWHGGKYCGEGNFASVKKARAWATDGFCDRAVIRIYDEDERLVRHFKLNLKMDKVRIKSTGEVVNVYVKYTDGVVAYVPSRHELAALQEWEYEQV